MTRFGSRFIRPILVAGLMALPAETLAYDSTTEQQRQPAGALTKAPIRHGLAMHGKLALPADFERFPYASPKDNAANAPGGRLTLGVQGTFDSLNPLSIKGLTAPPAVQTLTTESLMRRSLDEPFSLYGLVARGVETPADRSYVTFHLDPRARFSDGAPLRAEDVLFSFNLLKEKGRPNYRNYFSKVSRVSVPDPATIRFDIADAEDRELPLIIALMPILAKHATDPERFNNSGFTPLLGSGPYRVAEVSPGSSITFKRNPDYWGAELPVSRGLFNFDEIRYSYFRDANGLFEAFKAGLYEVRLETDPTRWTSGYNIPAVRDGRIVQEHPPSALPKGMSGFVFNTRKPMFADASVREALSYLFDFEWVNRNLFDGVYRRTGSYFADSVLASTGRPADAHELAILKPFPDAVRPDILAGTWRPPESDGSGRDRASIGRALEMLEARGFKLTKGRLTNPDGEPFSIEIMVLTREQERLSLNLATSLARIGIAAKVRLVDSVQYERRRQRFDYDMMIAAWPVSPSPGNEQYFRWGSASAKREASFNFAGAQSPATDAAIAAMLAAGSEADFTSAVRALDRTLLSGFYVIPLFHLPDFWIARQSGIARPEPLPLFGPQPEQWWRTAPVK